MTTTSTLPPPLSAPPNVATLQGLLDGLQQPMHRGVPSPPTPPTPPSPFDAPPELALPHSLGEGSVLDLTRLEQLAASAAPAQNATAVPTPSAPAAVSPPPVSLTWSAGRAPSHPRRTAAVAIASTAVVALAALAATAGELALP